MHVLEGVLRPKNRDIHRTLEWWKGLMESSTAFAKNGVALNRMDGENSVLIVRHTFDGLGDEQVAWDTWQDSETGKRCLEEWDDYVEGAPTFHRYNVLHSY